MSFSSAHSDLRSLETAVASAGRGFACMFSSSDEYENALIAERRAEGRYGVPTPRRRWRIALFVSACLLVVATVVRELIGH